MKSLAKTPGGSYDIIKLVVPEMVAHFSHGEISGKEERMGRK
jgi:hypothetical protein